MCGIFGFIGKEYSGSRSDLQQMHDRLVHRGPDFFGFYSTKISNSISLNFGHSRLSIIDTSGAGGQPMHSRSGRYTIVFNGEIYNFQELRDECERIDSSILWNGHSDTEVIINGLELMGGIDFVEKMVGMFAIALWDNSLKKFYLIRDRIGEKPLYYGYQGGQLIFASELSAIEAHSKFVKKLNKAAAVGFLLRSYVPDNLSIYENIYKVKPGVILEFELDCFLYFRNPKELEFWSLAKEVEKGETNSFSGSYEDAKKKLELLLIQAVKKQSISDVPFGVFLSGGIDSSMICAIMKKYVKDDLLAFTIGMPEPGVNEAKHAERVAHSIGVLHKVKYLEASEILNRVEEIISKWDEPFADSSQIPTFFVSELAKEYVTVVLSGDGADEFFYGYIDHKIYKRYKKFSFLTPLKIDKLILRLLRSTGFSNSKFYHKLESLSYLLKLMINYPNLGAVHANWHNKFWDSGLPVLDSLKNHQHLFLNSNAFKFRNVGHYDALSYLPDDILVKVDRAAMAVSLESRAPFLDHRILAFLLSLPQDFLYNKGVSKRILKDILYDYVPGSIVNRPKQGFSIPVSYWLRNDLKEWAQKIIESIPDESDFWDKKSILKIWNQHQEGTVDHPEKIWNILVLELFFRRKSLLHYSNVA